MAASATDQSRPTIFTVGHSRHSLERFLAILRTHGVERIVDVRSQPWSKWASHFDRALLGRRLPASAVDYVFLGDQLGGRPAGAEFYRADGSVDYALRSTARDFRDGVEQLLGLARERSSAILCAEEDPVLCHRRLLVAPTLIRAEARVVHVRGDGRLEPERGPSATRQLDLFQP